jgi:hypothetical protein
VRSLRLLSLKDPELLAQKEDLEIFVMVGAMTQPDEVEEQRERAGEKIKQHGGSWCRDHAEGDNGSDAER